jgi:hypothetical protein
MSRDTGGPAFPCDNIIERNENGQMRGHEISSAGMTLRDAFAMKAMGMQFGVTGSSISISEMADRCYAMADAMLAARSKEPE